MRKHASVWSLFVLATFGVAHAATGNPLEIAISQQVQAQAPGAQRMGRIVEGRPTKTDWSPLLEAGKCYWFGAAGVGIKRIAIYMWGPDGRRVADARPDESSTTLAFCPPFGGAYHVQAKVEGKGSYAMAAFVRSATAAPPPLVAPPASARAPGAVLQPYPSYPASYPVYAPPVYAPYPTVSYSPYPAQAYPAQVYPVYTPAAQPGPQCYLGADGINVCGYNCELGANGHEYCSSVPNGHCALNANGTFSCPGAIDVHVTTSHGAFDDNKGVRNDPCGSSNDCGFGLFCKEDSDGERVCM